MTNARVRPTPVHDFPALANTKDHEAEAAIVRAVLRDNEVYWSIAQVMDHCCFSDPFFGECWRRLVETITRGGLANIASMNSGLLGNVRLKELNESSGGSYFRDLLQDAGLEIDPEATAKHLRSLWMRRELFAISTDASRAATDVETGDPESVLAAVSKRIRDLSLAGASNSPERVIHVVRRAAGQVEQAFNNPGRARIRTGLTDIDEKLGGLFYEEVTVIGASPNQGKTALMGTVSVLITSAGKRGLIFSQEMGSDPLGVRFLSREARVPGNLMVEGRIVASQMENIAASTLRFADLPLWIDGESGLSVDAMRVRAEAVRREEGELDFIMIDHLEMIEAEDPRAEERVRLGQVSRDLSAWAKDDHLAVGLIVHLNREYSKRATHRPVMTDLYGSSALEKNADNIWFLHREEYFLERNKPDESKYEEFQKWQEAMERARGKAEVFSVKRRHGPVGSALLRFEGPYTSFSDLPEGM